MDEMYRENILDHAKNPRFPGVLDPADYDFEGDNPLCGDHLHMTMRVDEEGTITDIAWEGNGCAISQATASMLGELVMGKRLDDVRHLSRDDIFDMIGIPLTPNRMKCALLSLRVFIAGTFGVKAWRQYEDDEDDE
ncbi:iron-sulfur cluster assembly scaffold protein [bacterium]|nr:iron-sulfur cluster assembly scaffold protein [bacterium]